MKISAGYRYKIAFWLSIVLVAFIAASSVVTYFTVQGMLLDEAERSGTNTVTQLQTSLETVFDVLNNTLLQAAMDSDLKTFADQYENLTIFSREALYDRLYQLRAVNRYVSSLYVYYHKPGMVLNFNRTTVLYQPIDQLAHKGLLEAARAYGQERRHEVPVLVQLYAAPEGEQHLLLSVPITPLSATPRATLVVVLNEAYMQGILQSIATKAEGNVYVLDADGQLLFVKNGSRLGTDVRALSELSEGSSWGEDAGGSRQWRVVRRSQHTGWTYVYQVAEKDMMAPLGAMRVFFLLQVLVVLILAAVVAWAVSARLYRPVERLVTAMKEGSESLTGDEMEFIHRGILGMQTRQQSMEKMLEENQQPLKEHVLERLLRGKFSTPEDIRERLAYHDAACHQEGWYCCAVAEIDQLDAMTARYGAKQADMLMLLQRDFFAQVLDKQSHVLFEIKAGKENELHMLASVDVEARDVAQSILRDVFETRLRQAAEEAGITITLGVGSLRGALEEIPQSFLDAKAAYAHKVVAGRNSVIWWDDLPTEKATLYSYPYRLEGQIFHAVKQADEAAVRRSVAVFFSEIRDGLLAYSRLKYVFVQLFGDTMRLLQEISLNSAQVFKDPDLMYDEVESLETLGDAEAYFLTMFVRIAAFISGRKGDTKEEEPSDMALRYIEAHLFDESLSLESMSQELHYSVSYLVRIFKIHTGKSIREYIIERRIEEAKTLMQAPGAKVGKIAEQVGYPNVRSFINIFKKYTGKTPGEFKAEESRHHELGD